MQNQEKEIKKDNGRELKFRAWDKQGKVMEHSGWCSAHMTALLGTENGRREFILMQYTGLKDKNGKEIYEGDVVKQGSHTTPFFVEYNPSLAGFVFTTDLANKQAITFCLDGNVEKRALEISAMEVIGNIYEHSDLLK